MSVQQCKPYACSNFHRICELINVMSELMNWPDLLIEWIAFIKVKRMFTKVNHSML